MLLAYVWAAERTFCSRSSMSYGATRVLNAASAAMAFFWLGRPAAQSSFVAEAA